MTAATSPRSYIRGTAAAVPPAKNKKLPDDYDRQLATL